MQAYDVMAIVYDDLTDDINYVEWYEAVIERIKQYQSSVYKVLEIGPGTGNMTELLVRGGLNVTALEPSEAMLSVLQEKLTDAMGKIQFFNGRLDQFKSKQKFDCAMAFLDVLNYIPKEELDFFFKRIHEQISQKGLLVIDFSTPYKLKEILGNHTFAENHDEFAYIWENHYIEKEARLEFDFIMFTEVDEGIFERHLEKHVQFAHDLDTILSYASKYFELLDVFGDHHEEVHEKSQRNHLYLRALEV